jgi:protein O-mannosyl-transferase
MKRELIVVFVAAVALYLPTSRYGFVQDDRAIIASNPAAHSIGAALAAFDDPYWPRESEAGLYRPLTILSYALDWTLSGGRAGWLHVMNALWHGVAAVLFVCVMARWLPPIGAAGAGLAFAWHPVHVEAVASLVGRAELLVAAGVLGAVLAARRGWWVAAVICAALAMFSKEHGVIVGVVIVLDYWLRTPDDRRYPAALWLALALVTAGFLAAWLAVGWVGENDAAAVFYGRGTWGRLAIALPAVLRAAGLLVWPASLSVDYGPQVIPARLGLSLAALLGFCIVLIVPALVLLCWRRAPAIGFAAGLAALSYVPTANLFLPSGVALAERNLYLAVALPAALVGWAATWLATRRGVRVAAVATAILVVAAGARSLARLPAWRDNRSQLLTLLADHPESYRAHASAAAVLAGLHDTAGARREYRTADSLFSGDPYLDGAHAVFLIGIGDTAAAVPLIDRRRGTTVGERMSLRAQFLLELARNHPAQARAIADSATRRSASEITWYRPYLHE